MKVELEILADEHDMPTIKVSRLADCSGEDVDFLFAAAIRRAALEAVRGFVGASTSSQRVDDLISEGQSYPRGDS